MLLFIPRGVIRCRKNSCPDYSSYIGQAEANIVGKKLKILKMNTCIRSAFLDNISINILKIVDNIVLLTLNKCRHILIETFMIKLEQNLLATYKFYKEKLHILKRIAKSFKPKI